MMNLDGLLGYIDLAKRKSGVPHYSKLTIKEKKYICLPWDRNPTTVDGEHVIVLVRGFTTFGKLQS